MIRQLRLDVFNGAHFEIAAVRIVSWGKDAEPKTDMFSWNFNGDVRSWEVFPRAKEMFAPPLNLAVKDKNWVTVVMKSEQDDTARLLWSTADARGVQSVDFEIRRRSEARTYNVEMTGNKAWHDNVVALGIVLPLESHARLDSISIADKPSGPADLR